MSGEKYHGIKINRRDLLRAGIIAGGILGTGLFIKGCEVAKAYNQQVEQERQALQVLAKVNEPRKEVRMLNEAYAVLKTQLYDDFFKVFEGSYDKYTQEGAQRQLKGFVQDVGAGTYITIPMQARFGNFDLQVGLITFENPRALQQRVAINLRALQMMPGPQSHFTDSEHPSKNELIHAGRSVFKYPKGLEWKEAENGIMAVQKAANGATRAYQIDNSWNMTLTVTSPNFRSQG